MNLVMKHILLNRRNVPNNNKTIYSSLVLLYTVSIQYSKTIYLDFLGGVL